MKLGKTRIAALGIAAALSSLLIGCGGGSGGSSSLTSSTGTSTGTGTPSATPASASGVISAFGSVFVNGTEYAVDSATTVVDGDQDDAASSASNLQVGMTVDVTASNGAATRIRFMSAVRGEVDQINTTESTLTVLGQTVEITSGTSFAGSKSSGGTSTAVTSISNISVGDYVVVYGYIDCTSSTSTSSCTGGATQVIATLVYEPGVTGIYRTMGYAENVNASADTFTINGLTVAYTTSGASPTSCTPSPCAITAGEFVEVRSDTAPVASGGTLTLTATRIKQIQYAPVLVSGEIVSIAGPVSNLNTTADTFTVRGVSIDGSDLATTVATLSDNEIVQVTGTVNATGGITATAITVEHRATFMLVGPLTAESASNDTITLLGQTFTLNSATRFADRAQFQFGQAFNLSNFTSVLKVGDQVAVSGYSGSSGFVATRVELLPTPKTAFVAAQGVVTAVSDDTLTIGGVIITLDASTVLRYPQSGGSPSISAFLDAITVGTSIVTVVGTQGSAANAITASYAWLAAPNCGWASGGP